MPHRKAAALPAVQLKPVEVVLFALSRSGHHAIAFWIRDHWPRPLDVHHDAYGNTRGRRITEQAGAHERLVMFEFTDLRWAPEIVGLAPRRYFILRDYYNWLASNYRMLGEKPRRLSQKRPEKPRRGYPIWHGYTSHVEMWKQYARAVIVAGRSATMLAYFSGWINYNQWFASQSYRARLAEELGLNATAAQAYQKVPRFGFVPKLKTGSSFDGMAFHGRASQMDVLSRWKRYRNDAGYRSLVDDEAVELNEQLFGMKRPW